MNASRRLSEFSAGLALAVLAFTALALVPVFAPAAPAAPPPPPYVVNAILPLTGSAAFLGQAEFQTLHILERLTNAGGGIQGRPVRIVIQDDQSNPQTGVQLATQVMARKVPVILGSTIVAVCRALAPLLKDGPVEYCFSPAIRPEPGSYVFTSSVSTRDLVVASFTFFRFKGWTRVAMLTSTDATGQDAEEGILTAAALPQNQNMQIVAREHFTPSDVSVAAQITRIEAAKPQVLIAYSTGTPIGTVFKGLAQTGLAVPVLTNPGNMTYAQMRQYASFLPQELYLPTALWPAYESLPAGRVKQAQKTFYEAFGAAGLRPDVSASVSWDPSVIVIETLRRLGTQATAVQIRDYIARLRGFAGVNGIYDFKTFPQRGLGGDDAIMTRWDPARQTWEPVSYPGGRPLK